MLQGFESSILGLEPTVWGNPELHQRDWEPQWRAVEVAVVVMWTVRVEAKRDGGRLPLLSPRLQLQKNSG